MLQTASAAALLSTPSSGHKPWSGLSTVMTTVPVSPSEVSSDSYAVMQFGSYIASSGSSSLATLASVSLDCTPSNAQ